MKKLILKGIIMFCTGLTAFITGYGLGAAFDAIDIAVDNEKNDSANG